MTKRASVIERAISELDEIEKGLDAIHLMPQGQHLTEVLRLRNSVRAKLKVWEGALAQRKA